MPIFLPETFRAPTGLQRAGHGSVAARARTAGRPSSLAPLALGWRRGQHVGVRFLSIFKVQASSHRLNSFFPLLLYQSLGHIRLCATLWTVAPQAPLSMGFSRREYWSGLPFPSPGDLPDSGIEPTSSALQVDSLLLSYQGSPI